MARKLSYSTSLKRIPTAPFHFDSTFFKPIHFPSSDTKWEKGKRWQTMLYRGEHLGLIFENKGSVENPQVLVNVYSENQLYPSF